MINIPYYLFNLIGIYIEHDKLYNVAWCGAVSTFSCVLILSGRTGRCYSRLGDHT